MKIPVSSFHVAAGDGTQVSMLGLQAFQQLSALPGPFIAPGFISETGSHVAQAAPEFTL